MTAQIAAVSVFLIMFGLIIWDKFERHIVTLLSGMVTVVLVFGFCMRDWAVALNVLNLKQIFTADFWYHTGAAAASSGINWSTIVFIAGMMIMVEGLAEAGFFS